MTLFIEKTWLLWWMLANVLVVRWFYVLSTRSKIETPAALSSEEDEMRYVLSWQVLRTARRMGKRARRALLGQVIVNRFRRSTTPKPA